MLKKASSAPAGWNKLYTCVERIRKDIVAPVDTIGCDKLADPNGSKEDFRFQTLCALILSAQTKDQFTAQAMERLKAFGCSAKRLSVAPEDRINDMIKMVGFHNRKATYLKASAQDIITKFKGTVPTDVATLCELPGVGPKMAHLFVQCADGNVEGIGVDVHVHRIVRRWGWVPRSAPDNPEGTRTHLQEWLPREYWDKINAMLVGFGQTICTPRWPKCDQCSASSLCPNAFKELSAAQKKARKAALKGTVLDDLEDIISAPPAKRRRQ